MAKYPVSATAQIDLFSLAFAPEPDPIPPDVAPATPLAVVSAAEALGETPSVEARASAQVRPPEQARGPDERALTAAGEAMQAALNPEAPARAPPRPTANPMDLAQTLAMAFAQRDVAATAAVRPRATAAPTPTSSPTPEETRPDGSEEATDARREATDDSASAERPRPTPRRAPDRERRRRRLPATPAPIAVPTKKRIAPIWERLDGPWARQVRSPFQPETTANKKKREGRYGELLEQFRALPPEARGVDEAGAVVSGAMSQDAEELALEMVALAWPGALDKIHYHLSKHDPDGHRRAVGMVAAAMLKGVQAYNPDVRGEKTGKQKAIWNYLLDEADFAVLHLKNESNAVRMTRAAENAGKDYLEAKAEVDRQATKRGHLRSHDHEILDIMNRVRRGKLPDAYGGLETIRAAVALEKEAQRSTAAPGPNGHAAVPLDANGSSDDARDEPVALRSSDRARLMLTDFLTARRRLRESLGLSEDDLVADAEHRRTLVKEMNAVRREATVPYPTIKSVRLAEQHARHLGGVHRLNKTVGESDDSPRRLDLLAGRGAEADGGVLTEDMLAAKKRALLREPNPHAFINAQLTQMGVPRSAISRGMGVNEKAFVDITATPTDGGRPFAHQFAPTTWDGTALKLIAVSAPGTPDLATRLQDRRDSLTDSLPTRLQTRLT